MQRSVVITVSLFNLEHHRGYYASNRRRISWHLTHYTGEVGEIPIFRFIINGMKYVV
jgi:hypothetical protein